MCAYILLMNRYLDNRTEIDELLRMENHKNTELLLPYPPDDVILSIGVVTASPNIVTYYT